MPTLSLISLTESLATFEVIVTGSLAKNWATSNNDCLLLYLGQSLQAGPDSWREVGQITKIHDISSINQLHKTTEQVKFKIEAIGDFKGCNWQSLWQLALDPFITPKIWDADSIEPSDLKFLSSTEKNQLAPNLELANSKIKRQYNFIPTVQNNERVIAGQKLGFVESDGNLFWLIVPNYQPNYQVKIKNGQFEPSEKIGELISQNSQTYSLTLKQPLCFNFLPAKKLEKMWNTGLLFDLFCPSLVGSRTILTNFSHSSLHQLVENLRTNFKDNQLNRVVVVTDMTFLATETNTFCTDTKYCLSLAQYFVLCGFEVVLIVQQTLGNWQEILNYFGNFVTSSEENASLSLFYVPQSTTELNTALPYFHNFWVNQNLPIQPASQPQTNNPEHNQRPDLARSFAQTKFEDILKNNLSQQNSILVNQHGTNHQNLPSKPTIEEQNNCQHPVFQLLFYREIKPKNSKNHPLTLPETVDKLLILWQFWQWFNQSDFVNNKAVDSNLETVINQLKTGQISLKKAKDQLESHL